LTLEVSPADEPAALTGPLPRYRRSVRRTCGRVLSRMSCALAGTRLGRRLHARILEGIELAAVDVELPGPAANIAWPRIAFLSDLHAGHYLTAADLERLAGLLMALEPDLVCLGGDLINHFHEELALLDPMIACLSAAPLGVHAVPGNHDYVDLGRIERWTSHLEGRGVRVLRNRGLRIEHRGAGLWLCGVDDLTEGEPHLADALAGRRAGEPTLLLSHHPDVFREASARGGDLQLSGHTHGGQIRLPVVGPVIAPSRYGLKYASGTFRTRNTLMHVSRGISSDEPIRINCLPELGIFTLVRQSFCLNLKTDVRNTATEEGVGEFAIHR
jgi:predicted MPP superfamily phosphohydrolase